VGSNAGGRLRELQFQSMTRRGSLGLLGAVPAIPAGSSTAFAAPTLPPPPRQRSRFELSADGKRVIICLTSETISACFGEIILLAEGFGPSAFARKADAERLPRILQRAHA